jgi:hypothetical protein
MLSLYFEFFNYFYFFEIGFVITPVRDIFFMTLQEILLLTECVFTGFQNVYNIGILTLMNLSLFLIPTKVIWNSGQ